MRGFPSGEPLNLFMPLREASMTVKNYGGMSNYQGLELNSPLDFEGFIVYDK